MGSKLHPSLSSQALIYHGNSIADVRGEPFYWGKFFKALAWIGLQETESYQEEVIDKGRESIVEEYHRIANQESSTNKCN